MLLPRVNRVGRFGMTFLAMIKDARTSVLVGAVLAIVMVMEGCATPVGINRVDTQTAHRNLTASVLSSDTTSETSNQVLHRESLYKRFDTDAPVVLADLHKQWLQHQDDDRLFALAELSFLHAQRTGDRRYYLASAVYAYTLLFPGSEKARLAPSDPRLRLTYDLYNRGLAEALAWKDLDEPDSRVVLQPGRRELPFGAIDITVSPSGFYWSGYGLYDLVSTAKFDVRGLRNRYRRPGIGAPLAASLKSYKESQEVAGATRIPARLKVPVTAFLRIEAPLRDLATGQLKGQLELYSADAAPTVTVDGRTEPLEYEPTAALAYTLEGSQVWDFELKGFLSAGLLESIIPKDRAQDGLFFFHPFRPDRIPLVLVHGTASSPGRWAEMINELEADPRIRNHYQIWLFIYTTGNPIGYSGGRLREALQSVMRELDPDGKYGALNRMVVIGHSQGGLLTKLTAIDSGNRFWAYVSNEPFDSFELEPETRKLLRDSLFFEPLPFVNRVVFIATPHRGSFLATGWLGDLASWLVKLPGGLLRRSFDALVKNRDALLIQGVRKPPTSINNMSPTNPFIRTLATIPVAPGIESHSIIAVNGSGPPEEGSDGVVKYTSAHIDGVASELVVRSGHSTQARPSTIEEVRRILLEHLDATPRILEPRAMIR